MVAEKPPNVRASRLVGFGNAKIHDANCTVLAKHHVVRFQIPMHHAFSVEIIQPVANPADDARGFVFRQPRIFAEWRAASVWPSRYSITMYGRLLSRLWENTSSRGRMLQAQASGCFLHVLKTGKETRITFKAHQRNFQGY